MTLTLRGCFTDTGHLKFDPYRHDPDTATPTEIKMNELVFDADGFLRDKSALKALISEKLQSKEWSWDCTAVALYHSNTLAMNTKGSYPTYYYFR